MASSDVWQFHEGPTPENPSGNWVIEVTESEAIAWARKAFQHAKPGQVDPRDDARALDEFIAVNWAWRKEVKHG